MGTSARVAAAAVSAVRGYDMFLQYVIRNIRSVTDDQERIRRGNDVIRWVHIIFRPDA